MTATTTAAFTGPSLSLRSPGLALPLAGVVIAAVALFGLLDVTGTSARLASTLGDSDDAARLVQVRDLMAGAPWFDTTVARIGAPTALVSHWSRLIDLGLATLITSFSLVLGPSSAEIAARFIWPLILFAPLMLVIASEAERRAGSLAAYFAIALVVTSITGAGEFTPGRIDHHGAMILGCIAGTLLLGRAVVEPRVGIWAGVALGLGTAVGYEALPLTIASVALAGFASLMTRRGCEGVATAVLAFAGTLALALIATTAPRMWLTSRCDALSINLVVLTACAATGLAWSLRSGARWSLARYFGVPLSGVLIGAALYAAAEPACLAGPFGQQDAAIGPVWLAHVTETQNLLWLAARAPALAVVFAVSTVFGLLAAYKIARAQTHVSGGVDLATLAIAVALACWQIKLMPYASLLAVLPLACVIARFDATDKLSAPVVRGVGLALSSQLVLGLLVAPAALALTPNDPALTARLETSSRCIANATITPLAAFPAGLVFADRDLGPFIAALTPHSVVAAPYHRIDRAILETDRLMFGTAASAKSRLRELGVAYVAICPGFTRAFDRAATTDSLLATLNGGAVPSWLQPLPLGGDIVLKAWRVVR